jgi:Ca-activated chloride channel homolog
MSYNLGLRSSWLPAQLLILLGALLPPSGLPAQDSLAPGSSSGNPWPQVVLNVVTLDRAGNPAPLLATPGFQVFQDGSAQTVQQIAGANTPITLALLLDSSGSNVEWRARAVFAARSLVDTLPPGSEVAVVLFNDHAFLDLPLTPVSSFTPKAFEHMESSGRTALFDALVATEQYILAQAHNPRRAIVVISDGGDNASGLSLQQTITRFLDDGAPAVYVLATPTSHPLTRFGDAARARAVLRLLAGGAGGHVFPAKRPEDIPAAEARISAILQSQVALTYCSTATAADGQMHRLDVRLNNAEASVHQQPAVYAPKQPEKAAPATGVPRPPQ